MIQQNLTAIRAHRARESTIGKTALRLGTQPNILRRVSSELRAVDPEAEEGVGEGSWVVDEDLCDVDVAD